MNILRQIAIWFPSVSSRRHRISTAPVSSDIIDLQAVNTSTFVYAHDISPWANLYPLSSGVFRAHLRINAADPIVYYEWSTADRNVAYSGGVLTLTAPLGALANFLGEFVYDCRWESADGQLTLYLFGGNITFTQASRGPRRWQVIEWPARSKMVMPCTASTQASARL